MKLTLLAWALGLFSVLAASAYAADDHGPTYTDAKKAGPDYEIQGEYEGTIGEKAVIGAQVVALGDGKFDAVIYTGGLPGAGGNGKSTVKLKGKTENGVAHLAGKNFDGKIENGTFSGVAENDVKFELKKVERKSPTLGLPAPPGALVLFDGTNTDAWKVGKMDEEKLLTVEAITKQKFADFQLHIEFRTPFMPKARGQDRGNSGVYLIDGFECQVLDSFGLEGADNECGGIYKASKPLVNMCYPPLTWQTYDIDFRAPRLSRDGKTKLENAVVTVRHNGTVIHYNLELKHPTPGGHQTDEAPGPLFLQDHGNPVRYRNIWVLPRRA